MAEISCLADDYWLQEGLCCMKLVKGALALNRSVTKFVQLTLKTMPRLLELIKT
jgi:hypothetical protein